MSGITDDDKTILSALATGDVSPSEVREPEDPLNKPPIYDNERQKKLSEQVSRKIVAHSDEHGVDTTADYFGVSPSTVKRHRATHNPDSDYHRKIQFNNDTLVTEQICAVMRIMLQDGKTLKEIGEEFDVPKTTVQYHASENSKSCSHDLEIERVKLYDV